MKKRNLALAVITLLTAVSTQAAAIRFLGQTELNRRTEADVIFVGRCPSLGNPPVHAVRLRVVRNDANIDVLAVRYGNGQIDRLAVRERFRQGSASRWIDLRRGLRCVESIYVVGQTQGRGPNAVVRVFGAR